MAGLAEIVGGSLTGGGDEVVSDVTHDSRQVGPGSLYVAVPGRRFDGHDFARAAVERGASGLVVERRLPLPAPQIVVADSRRAMAPLAAAVHGYPSQELAVVGVTGTNGKTTVTHMIEAIVRQAGRSCGLIGTIETRLGERVIANPHTTPEATDFQRLLRTMADGGAEVVACEVSSHALALGRVDASHFAVAAFTNLSQDHLDFHGSMENYYQAKAGLFDRADRKVVWVDDPYGARLAVSHPQSLLVGREGQVRASEIAAGSAGTTFRLHLPDGEVDTCIRLPGYFNLANALVAAGCAHLLGFDPGQIGQGLERLESVPGRFEIVSAESPVMVVVDYAHTPEGIAGVIEAAGSLRRGRVIAVFGAGGDRDRSKRPAMGRAASAADLVVVTSDNPRGEDPEAIIDEIMAGVENRAVLRVPDRRQAIATALGSAGPGDVVLILGKGHEEGQEVAGMVEPFDDRQVARKLLEEAGR
jgi:UDP-N-acetylmuramoyl-L-alanyl-D-glutamate--2,6-diaminopimelate ligase